MEEEYPKIKEVDPSEVDNESPISNSDDEGELVVKFKKNILDNRKEFEKQLLDGNLVDFDPLSTFEINSTQEIEGDLEKKMFEMDQDILNLSNIDNDSDESKLDQLSRSMTAIPGYSGILKKIIIPGMGPCPPIDAIVTIHYNAYVEDETEGQIKSIDSTVLRGKPKTFLRGQGDTIEGLDIAVGTMREKEQSEFLIDPEFAFGTQGCPPRIPGNAKVFFKIELLGWVDSCAAESFGKLPSHLRKEADFTRVIEAAKSEKRKGNAQFEKGCYHMASKSYRLALNWIEDHGYANEEEELLGRKVILSLHLHLALVNLKVNKPKKTCFHCQEALKIDKNNVKALYRFGLAKEKLGDNTKAKELLLRAKELRNDEAISRAISELSEKIQQETYIEKEMCRKMFGTVHVENKTSSVSNDFREKTEEELREFLANPKQQRLPLPDNLTKEEIAFLETEVKKFNLKLSIQPLYKSNTKVVIYKQLTS